MMLNLLWLLEVVLNFQLTPYEKAIETLHADWQR